MSKKKADHIHKFKRVNLSKKGEYLVFKCTKPTCNYYISVKLALGQLNECNRCHLPFIITKETIDLALPHCIDCTKRRAETQDVESIAEFLNKSGI